MVTTEEFIKAVNTLSEYLDQIKYKYDQALNLRKQMHSKDEWIGSLDLSVRAYNALKAHGIDTIGKFMIVNIDKFHWVKVGKKTITELKEMQSGLLIIP